MSTVCGSGRCRGSFVLARNALARIESKENRMWMEWLAVGVVLVVIVLRLVTNYFDRPCEKQDESQARRAP
ncbi:hypothetical protein GCM10027436_55710 [Actinophytocola sediminis]